MRRFELSLPATSVTYGLCLAVVFALLPVDGVLLQAPVLVALVLLVLIGAALPLADRDRPQLAVPGILLFLGAVALLRSTGSSGGGYAPLVLLPVIWAATRERRFELFVALGGSVLVFVIPLVAIGAPHYPASGWRTAVLTLLVGAVVAVRVGWLVAGLRRSVSEADGIMAGMSEGFVLTRGGRIVTVNRALCEITGFSEADLVGGLPPYPFWPSDSAGTFDQVGASTGEAGAELEVELQRADGSRFPAAITANAADGGAFLSTVRDITVRRAHEEAILRRADGLSAIAEVTRIVSHSEPARARETICDVAKAVAEAATATIWEADATGVLRNTCVLGAPAPDFDLDPAESNHGACVAMAQGRALFVADAPSSPRVDQRMVELLGCASAYFQPIEGASGSLGVLVLSWSSVVEELTMESTLLLEVLAAEAATALEREALLRRLEGLSRTDELTGLPNRRAWDELLPRELAVTRRTGRPLSVAMLDLDHFKTYNDTRGHMAGDRLLRAAASLWRSHLRETDVLARWGGEEFVMLLPACDLESAAMLVGRLAGLLPDGVTFSAGVAAWDEQLSPDELVAQADAALYQAKASGRDRVVMTDHLSDGAAGETSGETL
jgi:diguanylate cyclase (GGDEF)-like protein/PAS domain S-box-containing protein